MDGYLLEELMKQQMKINNDISDVIKEMKSLPEIPHNINTWSEELSPHFKMSDFNKMFQINRKMASLVEQRDINAQKLKVVVIENLIEKINSVLNK